MSKRKLRPQPPEENSPEKLHFDAVINGTFGGWHHIFRVRWHRSTCCEVWPYQPLATFDYNHLTLLVVHSHDHCVRAEVRRNNGISILLTAPNDPFGPFLPHPKLERHVEAIRGYALGDRESYNRMYGEMREKAAGLR